MESQSEFFERIAGPFWDQVREVINDWWSHFPSQAQAGLRSRLLDRNSDTNVYSALWELYLHEMLLGSGCTVSVELGVGNRGRNPDFLVTRGGERFVVEAIWKTQRLGGTVSDTLPSLLVDAIDSVPSPNFFLSYRVNRAGTTTPPQKRLKTGLIAWLAGLDPDQIVADREHKLALPEHTWAEAGWDLSFEAIPRSPGKRGDSTSRAIGIHAPVAWFSAESDRVLDAVKEKGSKYGELGMPFIVAVGHAALFPEDSEVETALYGSSVEYVHNESRIFGRRPGGYWNAAYDHAHSQVGGVLVVKNPAPWTWTKNLPALWRSPDPDSLPVPVLPAWAAAQLVGAHVERQPPAHPIHAVLGLPKDWPIGDAFPQRH
ncbi:hypothetical protein [Streptomyces sp. CB01201]|uniref:hypothetical protein n=1 Tax=Streptomyces sp. CB01201 TaxID=2020324 RepID=UPI001F2092C7|nr:hypothetical protein [Streptomyces sp. CB01201]